MSAVSTSISLFKRSFGHHCFRNKVLSAVSTDIKTWPHRKEISEISLTFPFDALRSPTHSSQVCADAELHLREHLALLSENKEGMGRKMSVAEKL